LGGQLQRGEGQAGGTGAVVFRRGFNFFARNTGSRTFFPRGKGAFFFSGAPCFFFGAPPGGAGKKGGVAPGRDSPTGPGPGNPTGVTQKKNPGGLASRDLSAVPVFFPPKRGGPRGGGPGGAIRGGQRIIPEKRGGQSGGGPPGDRGRSGRGRGRGDNLEFPGGGGGRGNTNPFFPAGGGDFPGRAPPNDVPPAGGTGDLGIIPKKKKKKKPLKNPIPGGELLTPGLLGRFCRIFGGGGVDPGGQVKTCFSTREVRTPGGVGGSRGGGPLPPGGAPGGLGAGSNFGAGVMGAGGGGGGGSHSTFGPGGGGGPRRLAGILIGCFFRGGCFVSRAVSPGSRFRGVFFHWGTGAGGMGGRWGLFFWPGPIWAGLRLGG